MATLLSSATIAGTLPPGPALTGSVAMLCTRRLLNHSDFQQVVLNFGGLERSAAAVYNFVALYANEFKLLCLHGTRLGPLGPAFSVGACAVTAVKMAASSTGLQPLGCS